MPFWKTSRPAADRITSDQLADFGRYSFLGEEASGIKAAGSLDLVRPLAEPIWMSGPGARENALAEIRRHAERGEWEKVGAWKFVREFLDETPETADLIDAGLSAIIRMRVTNLAIHLAPIDRPRYEALAGGPPPNDGFFGPPVFDSNYGPTRQYYLDNAVAAAARRSVTRLPHAPGVAPQGIAEAARAMWDFGMLVYRGPLVVNPDIAFEPNVVRPAVQAARNADHASFINQVAKVVFDPSGFLDNHIWGSLGAARFAEDYLAPEGTAAPGYHRLLEAAIRHMIKADEPGTVIAPDLLTPLQLERLARLRAAG